MEEKKLTDDDMLSKVTDWLRTKAKTDGDMYYVGVIVGEFLVAKRQKEEIDILRGEIERLKEMCSRSSFKDSWKNKFFKAQEEQEKYFVKACYYYLKCKSYGIENFYDEDLELKPAKEGKTISFKKFKGVEVE